MEQMWLIFGLLMGVLPVTIAAAYAAIVIKLVGVGLLALRGVAVKR